ncbi:hypothetical protein M1E25_24420 [Streptomyces sp. MTZ3.1]|uniref:Uncharacterized protein n=1 Tax=Streptomyces meridianus TaxID=2938945 RepID=A0ABT0XF70_9ACTN|nr:hypothetical protein [Streptomyces meridianus]MCM2580442.1 hypothetical protein [Streptomyces meridianus]
MANSQRGKGQKAMRPDDFIPAWDGGKRVMSPEEMFAAAVKATTAMGGTVRTNS